MPVATAQFSDDGDKARRVPVVDPFLAAGACFIAALAASLLVAPLSISHAQLHAMLLGLLPTAMGLAAVGAGVWELLHCSTGVSHWSPTSQLVTQGVFVFTRNPMYCGMVLTVSGMGIMANTWWGCIAAAPLAAFLHLHVLPLEEAGLARQFGLQWTRYADVTPAWL